MSGVSLTPKFCCIIEPVVDMREEPMEGEEISRVESQALLGERVTVEEERRNWALISTPDKHKGWVPIKSFIPRAEAYPVPKSDTVRVSRGRVPIYHKLDTEWGKIHELPWGTRLQVVDRTRPRWITVMLPEEKGVYYIQRGDVVEDENPPRTKKDLAEFSKRFLKFDPSYHWGGRSSFGFDCSGFVQMLYAEIGILLPRNSGQQMNDDRFKPITIEAVEPGDLVFFGLGEQKVNHVGMCIGNGEFIHSCVKEDMPYLRISKLSDFQWSGIPECKSPFRAFRQLKHPLSEEGKL